MQPTRFLYWATLTLMAAGAMAAAPVADVALMLNQAMVFQDYSALYGRIIADRQLGNPNDESLVRQVQSQSIIERFRDGSADPVAVIRVELLDQDGNSKARSEEGNYSYYVLRETATGLTLLGRMYGSAYRSVVTSGNREFFVDLQPAAGVTTQMHYRIEEDRLFNLSPPPPGSAPPPGQYDNSIAAELPLITVEIEFRSTATAGRA